MITTIHTSLLPWVVSGARLSFLHQVRNLGRDELGQPVVRYHSRSGGEPLRDRLRRAQPGEEILLGSQALFDEESPFREFGPVYVTAVGSLEHAKPAELFAGDYFREELVLRCYDRRRWIAAARRVRKADAQDVIDEWLDMDDTAFVDARFPEYGCFACRFERASRSPAAS